jgi:two-component system, cell cycle sensor histidine kinase and response regulator CckA
VLQSGGSVDVSSEVGSGTAFRIYLPRTEAAEVPDQPHAPAVRPRSETVTFLVVEDSDGLRQLVKRLLEKIGYKVLAAANGAEALMLFDQHPSIDVLLTDVVMPGTSGPELTKQLIERRPGLKVIFMSGYTEEAIVRHGVVSAGVAFLHKPFTSGTLASKIRDVLDS